jgi:hypothetical protein
MKYSQYYLYHKNHFDEFYPNIEFIDHTLCSFHSHGFIPPKQTRQMTDEEYNEFYREHARYFVYRRQLMLEDFLEEMRDLKEQKEYDPLLKEWYDYTWQSWLDLDAYDTELLQPELDDDLREAIYWGTIRDDGIVVAPPITPMSKPYMDEDLDY